MKALWFCALPIILALYWGTQSQVRTDVRVETLPFTPYLKIPGDFSPSWSPDGRRIVYATRMGEAINLSVVSSGGGVPAW